MIRGEKVLLRTVRESDIETLFALSSDLTRLGEFQSWTLRSEIDLRKKVQENGLLSDDFSMLLIVVDDKIIGTIIFFKALYYDGFEIGYLIYDPEARNHGYATDALRLLCEFLFFSKKINRLQLGIIQGNIASKKVAEKCGFHFEGVLRGAIFQRGENRDLEMFSLLRADLMPA